ncbi:hypothetical protein CSB09_02820 [Candidatus Gracilibacteria bacterium]|nr:MAG: hypothetical protein CSB09_02820 [Candidatus Gracilibacteria bacterium]
MKNTTFLSKIKHFFATSKEDKQFQKRVQKEKKQKYLFDASENDKKSDIKRKTFRTQVKSKSQKKTKAHISTFVHGQVGKKKQKDLSIFMSIIAAVLFILSGYIVWFSPYFKISPNQVIIEGINKGIDMSLAYKSIEYIYGSNIFSIDQKKIAAELKSGMKNIESIEVNRLYPNGIKILIKSLPNPFDTTIYGVAEHRWGLSTNGVLIPIADLKNNEFQYHLEIISYKLQSSLFRDYKKIISDLNAFLLQRVFAIFENEWSDLKITGAKYFLKENEVHLILESNTKIIFTLQDITGNNTDIKDQISREFLGLKEYIQNHKNTILEGNIVYIDARIPGKLFICSDAKICNNNLINVYGNAYKVETIQE